MVLEMNRNWQFLRPRETISTANSIPDWKDGEISDEIGTWEEAILPHSVRLEPRDVSGGRNYQGVCWYKKSFITRPEWKGKVIYIRFEGAMQVAEVWLNGHHLTTNYCGYIPFTVDITKALKQDGMNILVLQLDNKDNPEIPPGKPQSELDFTYFGGLYRRVEMQVLDPLHITDPILADKVAGGGIFVSFPSVSERTSTVQIKTDIVNESDRSSQCTVKQHLIEVDGSILATSEQNLTIAAHTSQNAVQTLKVQNARLWHPESPHLYTLHTVISRDGIIADDQYTRIGIRSIEFSKDHGLLINGKQFFSIGANRHQDHPYVGYALPSSAHYRDAYKLREAGFTSYRSHYPQDPSFMDACDELGILAIVSNPGWQFVGDDLFKRRAIQDARLMVRRDRNRPSIAIWEAALNETDNSSIAAELYRAVHEEYPVSSCYTAGDPIRKHVDGFNGWDVTYVTYEKKDSQRASWIREWGDEVDNWSDQQGRVRVARSWGETPMLVQAMTHTQSMNRIFLPDTKPAGACLWAGIDAFRGYHHQPFLGAPLDMFRLPKFDYYMFQSQRPAEVKTAFKGSGPMVFIANYASFYSPSTIVVFSNCEQVRLKQNGREVGVQKPDAGYVLPHPPFTFKVGDFSNSHSMLFSNGVAPSGTGIGELVAEGIIDGKIAAIHTIHSPGVPESIRLQVDSCGIAVVADGSDWVRVYASVCDARGTVYPFADDLVTFEVGGEGSLVNDGRILANPIRAEAGIATGIVKASTKAGIITVRAVSPGLKEDILQFESVKEPKASL
jgi:beta-galactosidase